MITQGVKQGASHFRDRDAFVGTSRAWMRAFASFIVFACLTTLGKGQQTPDPYRNFVGSWSGDILFCRDPLPKTVVLTVSESQQHDRMLWDYVFGHTGEKGYVHVTKLVRLNVVSKELITQWSGGAMVVMKTSDLTGLSSTGYGSFTATDGSSLQSFLSTTNKVTYDLQPSTFTYVWERRKNGRSSLYSNFVFTRVTEAAKGMSLEKK